LILLEKVEKGRTRHFSVREEPWHFREDSVVGGVHAVAPAEFFVESVEKVKKKPENLCKMALYLLKASLDLACDPLPKEE
jgi:hypothetical protein